MSNFIPSAQPTSDSESSLLLDSSLLQKSNLRAETGQMTFCTSLVITVAHFGIGIMEACYSRDLNMWANFGFSLVSLFFTISLWRNPTSIALMASGGLITLASMGMFLFVSAGPAAAVAYILAPIPAFRILGLKGGWPVSLAFLALATFSLFGTDDGALVSLAVRVNIMIGFFMALAFAWVFEVSRQRSVARLEQSLKELRVLHGLISICSSCKKVKEGENTWRQLEAVLQQDGLAEFTHGLCKPCMDNALNDLQEK